MKEVIIKSKIVGKEGAIGGGKPIAFPDLSAYALRSDFIRLESSFNDFLEGDDTDNVINRWKELEAFLNNISEDYNLLSLLNGKADKATTLSGYGITDAYTKTNVDDLLKACVTLAGAQTITGEKNFTGGLKVNGSPIVYDSTNKYWKLEGDLLVTGGVTMYGSDSSFVPSTIMDAIAVDGTTISKSGGVLKVIGGTGGGVADSVAWANITGKPTWIGSSKPTYSYSEITGAISTTELQNYLTSNSYLNVTSGDNRYLKLSGGTIKNGSTRNPFVIDTDSSTGAYLACKAAGVNKAYFGYDSFLGALMQVNEASSNTILYITNNQAYVSNGATKSKLWNEGNDGSDSGLDADLLDGQHLSDILASNVASATKATRSRCLETLYSDGSYWYDDKYKLYAQWATDNTNYLDIKVDGYYTRVDVSKKLNTARTIWGQSFDGTGNVSGNMNGVGIVNSFLNIKQDGSSVSHLFLTNPVSNVDYGHIYVSNYDNSRKDRPLALQNGFGNVGIGLPNPSAKLHVSGNILATGGVTMYSMRKLKNVVDERGLSLTELSTIKPTRYTWKDGRDNRLHFGGIADDIQQVLPEVVYKTSDGVLTMDYGNAAFAVAASLIKPVVDHENRIAILEEENKKLKQEVERLKSA